MNKIAITNAHGTFAVTPAAFDRAMLRYLPATVAELRREVEEVHGGELDYSDVDSVSELLMVLADAFGEYTAADAAFDKEMAAYKAKQRAMDAANLTVEEYEALAAYAAAHGRTWKAQLRNDWMSAREVGILQELRNSPDFGPSGLINFRLTLPAKG